MRTFREDHFVVVEIGDNGSGIPCEIRPRIFDPFFTTKGIGEGTGLGLNTGQTIVRKHGGKVDSKPGDTRFQVWLPFAAPPAADNNQRRAKIEMRYIARVLSRYPCISRYRFAWRLRNRI